MRINAFVARATGIGRRQADRLIASGRVSIDHTAAKLGDNVSSASHVTLDTKKLELPETTTTILLNKPLGYVVSRRGQGAKSVYTLLPWDYRGLKAVGRLDKETSGLLLFTNDGALAQKLAHPGHNAAKVYTVVLDKPLERIAEKAITRGVRLDDGLSKLGLASNGVDRKAWSITMHEGRKRQIRRTFQILGYKIIKLHRVSVGPFKLGTLKPGSFRRLDQSELRGIK